MSEETKPRRAEPALPCCGHPDSDHSAVTICEVQIHYSFEDEPCLCDDLTVEDQAESCLVCAHPVRKHLVIRTCNAGLSCTCREVQPVTVQSGTVAHGFSAARG